MFMNRVLFEEYMIVFRILLLFVVVIGFIFGIMVKLNSIRFIMNRFRIFLFIFYCFF